MYYKNKTKAYEKWSKIYGSYTRVIGDDVNDHYYYKSNFADGYYGIRFCDDSWYIGKHSNKDKCQRGYVYSNFNTDKCIHDIDFYWKYFDASVGWTYAREGLAVKCLYEPGNYNYFKTNSFHSKIICKTKSINFL